MGSLCSLWGAISYCAVGSKRVLCMSLAAQSRSSQFALQAFPKAPMLRIWSFRTWTVLFFIEPYLKMFHEVFTWHVLMHIKIMLYYFNQGFILFFILDSWSLIVYDRINNSIDKTLFHSHNMIFCVAFEFSYHGFYMHDHNNHLVLSGFQVYLIKTTSRVDLSITVNGDELTVTINLNS